MGKRDWKNDVQGMSMSDEGLALWAIVERLEALVAIGDALEEVADLWANTLAFGGQPVGGIEELVPATRGTWMCDGDSECVLMKGHGGEHIHASWFCRCKKPVFAVDAMAHERRNCVTCGLKER